jgi:hypothetical protein
MAFEFGAPLTKSGVSLDASACATVTEAFVPVSSRIKKTLYQWFVAPFVFPQKSQSVFLTSLTPFSPWVSGGASPAVQ